MGLLGIRGWFRIVYYELWLKLESEACLPCVCYIYVRARGYLGRH